MSESPVLINNPEAYQPVHMDKMDVLRQRAQSLDGLPSQEEMDFDQAEIMAAASRVVGVDYRVEPDQFITKHIELLDGLQETMTNALPAVKERMVEGLVSFLGLSPEAAGPTREELIQRLASTQEVIVNDNLFQDGLRSNGRFLNYQRQIVVSGRALTLALDQRSRPDFENFANDNLLSHEVLHGAMVSGTQETFITPHFPIRNGLRLDALTDPLDSDRIKGITYGEWLSEAVLEYVRRQVTGVDEGAYTTGVIVLEVAEKLDPGIIKEAAMAAFLTGTPAVLFGRLEKLFGPYAVNDLDEATFIAIRDGWKDFESEFLELVPTIHRQEARAQLQVSRSTHLGSLGSVPD